MTAMEDKLFELGSNGDPQKHFCTYCMNSINDVVFSCADCTDEIFLCMQCYVSGAEIGSHKKIHAVKMIDLGTFPVFGKRRKPKKPDRKSAASTSSDSHNKGRSHKCKDSSCRLYASGGEASDSEEDVRKKRQPVKRATFHYELDRGVLVKKFDADPSTSKKNRVWRALDELELLDAIQRYGYGNWKDIASTLSSGMPGITPEEVADHYAIHYILTDIGDYTWDWKTDCPRIMDIYAANEERKNTPKDPLSTFDDISQFELDALGFMPKRNDFEREFDNEAESLISNLTVNPGEEDEIERKFKSTQIEMYQQRLVERFRKKAAVQKFGLVRKFLQANNLKGEYDQPNRHEHRSSGSSRNTELSSVFSPFIRFSSAETMQNLYLDLQKEFLLKIIIRKLLKYKKRGLTKMSEIRDFEDLRKSKTFRDKTKQLLLKSQRAGTSTDAAGGALSDMSDSDDEEYGLSLNTANFEKIMAPIPTDKLKDLVNSLAAECAADVKTEVKEEDDEEMKSLASTSRATLARKSRRKSQPKPEPKVKVEAAPTAHRSCRKLGAADKKFCSDNQLPSSLFLKLKAISVRELNSKNFAKGRRFSIPFVMENEPSSLQAELLAAYGPNTSNVEVDRLMNKLAHHLVATGDVPNSIL